MSRPTCNAHCRARQNNYRTAVREIALASSATSIAQAPNGSCVRLFEVGGCSAWNCATAQHAAAKAADYEIACQLRFDCRALLKGVVGIGVVTNHAAIRPPLLREREIACDFNARVRFRSLSLPK